MTSYHVASLNGIDHTLALVSQSNGIASYDGASVTHLTLCVGSRPAKRKGNATVTSLRAIPWIFAWTQSRFHLPVWLGMGEAFEALKADGKMPMLREMYKTWPFFRVTMDLIEMVLAKVGGLLRSSTRPTALDRRRIDDSSSARLHEVSP